MSDPKSDIWRLQAQFDIQGLISALKQEDAGMRKRAAAALRAIGAKEAVPSLRVALVNERNPEVRSIIAAALDTLSDVKEDVLTADIETSEMLAKVNNLIVMLDSEDPDQVIDAAQQLGEIGDKIAVEPLVMVFNNMKVSIQVRLAVAEALLKLEGAPVEVALLAALRHNDWHIRRNGAAILGQLKASWAVDPLSRALTDPHTAVRKTARAALQRIGTTEANEVLRRRPSGDGIPKRRPTATTGNETVPSAPRDGLLNRLNSKKQEDKPPVQEDMNIKHIRPTQPLDPRTLEELERRQQAEIDKLINPSQDDSDDES